MTKFDYPIENIRFNFNLVGGGFLACSWNGKMLTPNPEYNISADQIEEENTLSVAFAKFDPADEDSYATLQYFMINGGSFKSSLEKQQYKVDKHLHPDAPEEIQFDGYFGYVGRLEIKINQCNDLLKKAAWTIADKEFEYTKWPIKGNKHRNKNFQTIHRDAKFMYTGSTPPQSQAITKVVNETKLKDIRNPLENDAESKIIDWISKSERVKINGWPFKHFTFSNGVSDSLESFVNNTRVIMMPPKMYYMHGELFDETDLIRVDPFERPIPLYANVLLEYPSPWYTNEELDNVIKLAKEKQAKIALDYKNENKH